MGKPQEFEMDTSYCHVMLSSGMVSLILSRVLCPQMSKLFPVYNEFSDATKILWNNCLISNFHAVLASSICVLGFIYEDKMNEDPIWADCPIVRTSCAVVAGYLIQDIIVMLLHWSVIGDWQFIFHHVISVYAYFYVALFGVVAWFANYRLLAEFSTFFVNNRWFFDTLKMKRTSIFPFINGICMTLSFFMVRILTIPTYWYKVYTVCGTPDFNALGHIKYVLYFTCFFLDILNAYWFYKMSRGVIKVLTQSSANVAPGEGSTYKCE